MSYGQTNSDITLVNVDAYCDKTFSFNKLTLRNSVCKNDSFHPTSIDTDLLSVLPRSTSYLTSLTIDLSSKLKENIVFDFLFSRIDFTGINEDISLVFSGQLFIIMSQETGKSMQISVTNTDIECHISNFLKQNLNVLMRNLFISSSFQKFSINISFNVACNFTVDQTEWECAAIKTFAINFFADSTVTIKSDSVPSDFYFKNNTNNKLILSNRAIKANILRLDNANLELQNDEGISGTINFYLSFLCLYFNSTIQGKESINISINYIYAGGEANSISFIDASVNNNILIIQKGSTILKELINNNINYITVNKPGGQVTVMNHITNGFLCSIRCMLSSIINTSDFNTTVFTVYKSDDSSIYDTAFSLDIINITGKNYIIRKKEIHNEFVNLQLGMVLIPISQIPNDSNNICLMENETFDDYCSLFSSKIYRDEFVPELLLMRSIQRNINLYVAGNISRCLYGIEGLVHRINIVGLIPNYSIVYTNESSYNSICLRNVTFVYVPPDTKTMMKLSNLISENSTIISPTKFIVKIYEIRSARDIIMLKYINTKILIIKGEQKITIKSYDQTIEYDGVNIPTRYISNISFIDMDVTNNAIANVYIYGNGINKVIFKRYCYIHLYCYNKTCSVNFLPYHIVYSHTNILPRLLVLPGKLFLLTNETHYKISRLTVLSEASITATRNILIDSPSIHFRGTKSYDFSNVTFNLSLMLFYQTSSLLANIRVVRLKRIVIDPISFVFLVVEGKIDTLEVRVVYYIGSVPYLCLQADVSKLNIVMSNNATSSQLYSYNTMDTINVTFLKLYRGPDNFTCTFISSSWAFNKLTRLFDVITYRQEDNATSYAVIRRNDENHDDGSESDDKYNKYKVTIIVSAVSFIVVVSVVLVFVIRTFVKKKKINKYISTLSESLVDV